MPSYHPGIKTHVSAHGVAGSPWRGDSASRRGEEFLSDTYGALSTALTARERERAEASCTMHEPPQFNRDHGSRVRLQHEVLDCAFFAACNVMGAMVGREADCTLPEARQLRALARDLLWSGATHRTPLPAPTQREKKHYDYGATIFRISSVRFCFLHTAFSDMSGFDAGCGLGW